MDTDNDADAHGKVISCRNRPLGLFSLFTALDLKQIIVFVLLPVLCSANRIVFSGQYAFALTGSAVLKYDLSSQSEVQKIGFFGKPLSIEGRDALYLLTTRGLFKTNPTSGQFIDIFPLYEFPQAMFRYKNSLDLLAQNELMIFDIAQKIKIRYSIALEPAPRIWVFSADEGRLFLAKPEGGLEIFEEGKRQLKTHPFPAGAKKIVAAGPVLAGTTLREIFIYDWKKGKMVRRLPVSEPVVDIAYNGTVLAASTNQQLVVVDIQKWQVVTKQSAPGWSHLVIENNQLFASQGNRVQIFNLPGLAVVGEELFPEPVEEFAIEPQTKKLVVASENRLYWKGGGVEEQPVLISSPPIAVPSQPTDSFFSIQVGAFGSKTNADNLGKELNKKGLSYYIVDENAIFKVRVGYFSSKSEALVASGGLQDHQPWVMSDRVVETVKPAAGMDVNHDGKIEWVVNPDERVVIFSLTGSVYKKVWESPADKKLKVGEMEDGQIQVETGEGSSGTIGWTGKQWELRF